MRKGKQEVRGVATVELAYIMPVVLLVFLIIVYTTFYYHDKNILIGEAAEAAVVGAQKERMLSGLDEGAVASHFEQRAREKVILLKEIQMTVAEEGDFIVASVSASHGRLRVALEKKQSKMEAEAYIRLLRRTGVTE